ncbi:MAG: hypothetical protein QOK39_1307 [Acidimicrobiaceae bacterium]|nr:hypothetical protein [Acidimicrobiaceae bacterium]
MANDQLIISDEPDLFLEYLLRCALTAPGAATSPTAGRILARLLVVGAIEGGDELITPYLVPAPGEAAAFEVRTYHPGDLVPMEVRDGLRAAAALKIALRGARDSDNGIEVVSRGESGLERCVLVRDSTGDFEFRFASAETLIGDWATCAAALAAWSDLFAGWRDGAEATAPAPVAAEAQPAPTPAPVAASAPAPVSAPADPWRPEEAPAPIGSRGWWNSAASSPGLSAPIAPATSSAPPAASAAPAPDVAPATSVPSAPSSASAPAAPDAAAQFAASPFEAPRAGVVAEAVQAPVEEPAAASSRRDHQESEDPSPVSPRPVTGEELAVSPATAEDLGAAIRAAIGSLVVEVDLGQVEQLIRRVLDDDRREMVEPLARRLSARLGESLEFPDTRTLVDAVAQVIPQPGDLAEAVASDIGALLSETLLRRRPGESPLGIDAASILAAVEQLHVRVDGLEDQFRKTASMLAVLGEHLDTGDRRAAIAERVTISVDQEMQRLANRIDEQVTALAASAGGGSELADGIARLTRKLRQSVSELDRVLVRLDQVVDQVGGERPRLGLPRGSGSAPAADSTLPRPPGAPRPPRPPAPPGRIGPSVRR